MDKPPRPERQVPLGRWSGNPEPRKRRSKPVSIYLDPDEEHWARREAASLNMSLSNFVRQRIQYEVGYGIEQRAEKIRALADDGRCRDALETEAWKLVRDLTGVGMPPRPEPPAPVLVAATPPPTVAMVPAPLVPPALPSPSPGTAVVPQSLSKPPAELATMDHGEPMRWEREPLQPTFSDAVTSVMAGVWRWLLRAATRAGHRMGGASMYHRLIGRTPLQFLVAIVFVIAAIVRGVGPAPLGFYLLGATGASAETVLKHLPGDEERRQRIGYVVMAVPANAGRINACLDQQRTSRHEFWCKFRMKPSS